VRRALPLVLALGLLVPAGCGNDRTKAPDVAASRGTFGWTPTRFAADGLSFERPKDWLYTNGKRPLLATMSAGEATVAVWRYPRTEALPATPRELEKAKDALVAAAKGRDPTFTVRKAKGTRAAHQPAVVIIAAETVAGQRRVVRSTHVYAFGGEVVVDAFAPPEDYPKVEEPVFRHIVRSLKLGQPSG
jgi:hypothetical protein